MKNICTEGVNHFPNPLNEGGLSLVKELFTEIDSRGQFTL